MGKKTEKRDGFRVKSYFQQSWHAFISSFKELDKRFFFVVLLDILLIALIYLGIIGLWKFIVKKLNYIPPMPIFNPQITPESELRAFYEEVIGIRAEIILYLIAFAIVIFLVWALIKSLQWKIVVSKKSNFMFYLKSLGLNAIWQLLWILIFAANFLLLNPRLTKFIGIILVIIYLHLSYIKYMQMAKTEKIFSSIRATLNLGILRAYRFVIPHLLMAIVLFLLLQLYWIYRYLPDKAEIVIFLLIIIVWIGWTRFYIYKIVET